MDAYGSRDFVRFCPSFVQRDNFLFLASGGSEALLSKSYALVSCHGVELVALLDVLLACTL